MALAEYVGVVQDSAGNAQSSVPVTVTLVGGGAATLYTDPGGGTILTAVTSDITGTFRFSADTSVAYVVTPLGYRARTIFTGGGPVGAIGPTGMPGVGANWRGVWSSATTYALGDGSVQGGFGFVSNVGSNLNHQPVVTVGRPVADTYWTPVSPNPWGADGNLDMGGVSGRIDANLHNFATVNGVNDPARGGDASTGSASDAGNGSAASFFLPITIGFDHETKGSAQGITVAGTLTAATSAYGEYGLFEGSLQIDRPGAYGAGLELAIIPTVSARAAGVQVVMEPSTSRAAMATALAGTDKSTWGQTGTRSFASIASGAATPGTAFAVQGNHEFALQAYFPTATNFLVASMGSVQLKDQPIFSLSGLGDLAWSDPATNLSPDLLLGRKSGVLATGILTGSLEITAGLAINGNASVAGGLGVTGNLSAAAIGATSLALSGMFGCNGATPVARAGAPGTATGTDAAVINAMATILRNAGFCS